MIQIKAVSHLVVAYFKFQAATVFNKSHEMSKKIQISSASEGGTSQLRRCLVNSAQNQLGPILTWPKTNSAQLNNQLGPRYVPTRPKHDSSLFLYYFLPFLAPICLSIRFFSFFHELDYLMALRYKTLEYEYVWLCTQYEVGLKLHQ